MKWKASRQHRPTLNPARPFVAALALLLPSLLWAQPQQSAAQARARGLIEQKLQEIGIPGMAVAVVRHDSLIWEAGFGLADVENSVAIQPGSVFRIASISKPITAVAVMQLVEAGKVGLDDPIQKYVPAFPTKRWPVTIRHLLTHTSGIRHYRPGEFVMKAHFDDIASAIRIFKDDTLLFEPGTKFSYTTYGYNLLAGVVERASGTSFEEYLRQHVWQPAGMQHTYFEHQGPLVPGRVRQYVRRDGRLENAPFADLSIKWAGGGMISTVGDLARFHIALDRSTILSKEAQERMYTPTALRGGAISNYGLGWSISTGGQNPRRISHSGGATGGTTLLVRQPEQGSAIVIFANLESARFGDLAGELGKIFFGPN